MIAGPVLVVGSCLGLWAHLIQYTKFYLKNFFRSRWRLGKKHDFQPALLDCPILGKFSWKKHFLFDLSGNEFQKIGHQVHSDSLRYCYNENRLAWKCVLHEPGLIHIELYKRRWSNFRMLGISLFLAFWYNRKIFFEVLACDFGVTSTLLTMFNSKDMYVNSELEGDGH